MQIHLLEKVKSLVLSLVKAALLINSLKIIKKFENILVTIKIKMKSRLVSDKLYDNNTHTI